MCHLPASKSCRKKEVPYIWKFVTSKSRGNCIHAVRSGLGSPPRSSVSSLLSLSWSIAVRNGREPYLGWGSGFGVRGSGFGVRANGERWAVDAMAVMDGGSKGWRVILKILLIALLIVNFI